MNQKDIAGNRHGPWDKTGSDGIRYKGSYIHGIFHGLWMAWDVDGSLRYQGHDYMDKHIGFWKADFWMDEPYEVYYIK